jgi:hypothetical protein
MSPDEIKKLVETLILSETRYFWVYPLLSACIAIIAVFLVDFFREKGKNDQEIVKLKRELKYNALPDSLSIIDAFLSNFIVVKEGAKIKKQFISTIETRTCHNNLILTCESPDLLTLFGKIMFSKSGLNEQEIGALFVNVSEYRNLVRKELGFGNELKLDLDNIWFASVNFEKEE